jgi:hypothetical protein
MASSSIANTADYEPIFIWFEDDLISYLFATLLQARGVQTAEVRDLRECSARSRIVTEPQYLPHLTDEQRRSCLLVGSEDHRVGLVSLTRPLTEEKIDRALSRFLAPRLRDRSI